MSARTLERLAAEAKECQACPLWKDATQTVFGEGPSGAKLLLVGEQPGDKEDLAGAPFVGPAGHLLDAAVEAAGLVREEIYVTNAVKHFKWTPRGKRRIHQKPNRSEIVACHQWLEAEIGAVDPATIVALGATAGQALLGPKFRVGEARGKELDLEGTPLVATVHPSSIIRLTERDERETAFQGFVADLQLARQISERR